MSDEDSAKTPVSQSTEPTNPSDQKTVEQRLADLELAIADIKKLLAEKQEQTDPQPSADSDPDADPEDLDQEIVSDEEVKQTLADSETLCPGMKRPAADAKGGKFTRAVMDRTMRNALKGAGVTMFGDSAEMDSKVLKTAFTAAVEMKRRENNPKAKPFGDSARDQDEHKKSAQELMNSFWNK